ncbi:hypothetical protein AAHC03_012946 [Spirometra sp. Aus1]
MSDRTSVITFSGYPVGDGYTWPLKPGCGEYDLTIEQLKQKEAKSRIAREVVIHRAYSGGLFSACAFGPRVACCFPWSGEGQLRVQVGDRVLVTRSYRRWIYGQLLVNPDQQNGTVVKRESPPPSFSHSVSHIKLYALRENSKMPSVFSH